MMSTDLGARTDILVFSRLIPSNFELTSVTLESLNVMKGRNGEVHRSPQVSNLDENPSISLVRPTHLSSSQSMWSKVTYVVQDLGAELLEELVLASTACHALSSLVSVEVELLAFDDAVGLNHGLVLFEAQKHIVRFLVLPIGWPVGEHDTTLLRRHS